MDSLKRYIAIEACAALRRQLVRKFPDVFIWGGVTLQEPYTLLVRASVPVKVPTTRTFQGEVFAVEFVVRNQGETNATDASTSSIHQDAPGSVAADAGEFGSSWLRYLRRRDDVVVVTEADVCDYGAEDCGPGGIRSTSEATFGVGTQILRNGTE